MRRNVTFLTVVWGERYIERFSALALPSFLAPGNLPAVAADANLEVVILTKQADVPIIEAQAAFRRLREICPVRFMAIDDLVTPKFYGFALTLAYARAVMSYGAEMVRTHFVFMNADFVLADGSLRSLLVHIKGGRSIVLAPSFRASAEIVEPELRTAVSGGTLSMPPRQLVALALKNPHPTTMAKTVSEHRFHSIVPNQFYWSVDENTMVGRFYLIFMLCLKPERVLKPVSSYCDYGFIPEMCPSGDEVVMSDSDEFFMLELQRSEDERDLLRLGQATDVEVAQRLSTWTTKEHRRAARHDLIFRSGDLPARLGSVKAQANAYIDHLDRLLGPPVSHVFHPYWRDAIPIYKSLREDAGLTDLPGEMARPGRVASWRVSLRSALELLILRLHRLLVGRPPLVTPLHPNWLDYVHLRASVKSVIASSPSPVLIVRQAPQYFDAIVPSAGVGATATVIDVLCGKVPLADGAEPYKTVLICLGLAESANLPALIDRFCGSAESDVVCHVFLHTENEEPDDAALRAALEGSARVAPGKNVLVVSFAGGGARRVGRVFLTRLSRHYVQFGAPSLLWIGPLLAFAFPFVLWTNLRSRIEKGPLIRDCSSLFARIAHAVNREPR